MAFHRKIALLNLTNPPLPISTLNDMLADHRISAARRLQRSDAVVVGRDHRAHQAKFPQRSAAAPQAWRQARRHHGNQPDNLRDTAPVAPPPVPESGLHRR